MFLENLKDLKKDRPKNTRIPRPSKIIQTYTFFKEYVFELIGFTCVWRLSTRIEDLLRFQHRIFRFYLQRSEIPIVFGPTRI